MNDLSCFRDFGGCSAITASIFERFVLTPVSSISNPSQNNLDSENSHLLSFSANPSLSNLDGTFDTIRISSKKQKTP